jgi:hypothetical protein
MTFRRIACPALVATLSCHAQSTSHRYESDPVVLVTPDTGPSALQQRLAAADAAKPGEPDARLDRAIDAFFTRTAAHRGYVAVDKPLYQPGETIWFRTFELTSAALAPGERDVTTFALISPRGATIGELRLLTEHGGAHGQFDLPPSLPGGEYVLRAKTDRGDVAERRVIVSAYQPPRIKKKLEFVRKAYGPGDAVTATVALHRATGEPLANKAASGVVTLDGVDVERAPVTTDAEGNAVVRFQLPQKIAKGDGVLTVLVDDGGVTESVQKRIPITLHELSLAVYPEGGDLIGGLPARVYFAATNPLGKPADVDGRVVDDRGRVVALLSSYHDGMGRFELVPDAQRTYHVEITRPVGIARTFELPKVAASGCAMQSIDDFASARPELRVAVWCTRAQRVAVTASLREARVATTAADVADDRPTVVALAMPPGAQGAVRVTVFDKDLAPRAERLVYRNRGKDLKISITPDKSTYHPRDRVTLALASTDAAGKPVAADLALSVVDDTVLAFADDKQATMLARLYLEAEMPGQKIEEPNFYFSSDAKAPASIDLVLGTHGWRRFDWKPVFAAPPKPPIDDPWAFAGAHGKDGLRRAPVRIGGAKHDKANDKAANGALTPDEPDDADKKVAAKPVVAAPAPIANRAPAIDPGAVKQGVVIDRMQDVPPTTPARPMPAPMHDMGGRGEMLAADVAVRHRRIVDLEVAGVEQQAHRGHQIREHREAERPPDPYCCLVAAREFATPSYEVRYDGPRTDFRETVLWRPRIATDATGKATATFYLSDAVTSFRVTAEGVADGQLGGGTALVQSKKPVSLAVSIPNEVTSGDRIRLPVTIANETNEPYTATLAATFGKAFRVAGGLAPTLSLAPNERRSTFYELEVVGDGKVAADGKIALAVEAANLRDDIERTVRIAPLGFPQELSMSGELAGTITREVVLGDVLPNTMTGVVTLYPSPIATMVKGAEAMIAEPGGCFEQASSTNYPNVMVLGYLEEHGAAAPQIVERAHAALDHGYKLLAGYETKTKGYEWFGGDPGHEALTAYGLLEFHDMAKVYGDVDKAMVDRTRAWLRGRRDGRGGFLRNDRQLDSFGRASAEVTDAYITYSLVEAGERDLDPEIARQRDNAATTKDPYILALATKVLLDVEPKRDSTRAAVKRLAAMQGKDGSFAGADHSITRSGGDALVLETTALSAMALLASGRDAMPEVRRAIEFIDGHRSGTGAYGSTQSTVLSLEALAQYAKASRVTEASGVVTLVVNGKEIGRVAYEKGHQGPVEIALGNSLVPGKNTIALTVDSTTALPYSLLVTWGSKLPATDPDSKIALATRFAKQTAKLGEGVHVDVRVTNTTQGGVPMTVARVGLPGGLTFQTWQLQELRDKKLVDFYETRPREVILYFRALAPRAVRDVPLELLASVPGTFTAPASRAYLYYTNEHKTWVAPATIEISR